MLLEISRKYLSGNWEILNYSLLFTKRLFVFFFQFVFNIT
jgi:hypothetical protein